MTARSTANGIAPTPKTKIPLHGAKRWAYLARQQTIRLATTVEDGSVYLSPLWFIVDNKKIFLSIDAAGRHGRSGEAGRALAGLVDVGDEFASVSGVRIVVRMERVDDAALRDRLNSLLFEK